jgi:uncharacterized protein YcbK (DUF882 family)
MSGVSVVRRAALCVLALGALAFSRDVAAAPKKAHPSHKRASLGSRAYARAVTKWHTPTTGAKAAEDEHGRPMLTLHALNTDERLAIAASSDEGVFSSRDLDRVAHLFREPSSASEHPIEPRLLDVLYRIQRKFGAQEIRLVSGFRPGRGTPQRGPVHWTHSNHACGRAADIIVPGARDEEVAKFARELGFVGVGIYPTSGFVHVDVRGHSYFWVDRSGPGKRNRARGVLSNLAKKSDARAVARGEAPTAPFVISVEVESSGDERPASEAPDEDDDV